MLLLSPKLQQYERRISLSSSTCKVDLEILFEKLSTWMNCIWSQNASDESHAILSVHHIGIVFHSRCLIFRGI